MNDPLTWCIWWRPPISWDCRLFSGWDFQRILKALPIYWTDWFFLLNFFLSLSFNFLIDFRFRILWIFPNNLWTTRLLDACDDVHQFPEIAGCSLGETFGESWKLCQYTEPIEAVHSNLRPCLTYFGLTWNVSPKAEVSSLSEPTVSTFGLNSISSPTN